jgi:hypothetical protein
MKTIKEINEDLSAIVARIKNKDKEELKPAIEKRLRKRITFLNTCIMYLEHEPTSAFIKSEIEKVRAKIDRRMGLFIFDEVMVDKKTVAKMRKAHEKQYEVPHLRDQLYALRFLLKD